MDTEKIFQLVFLWFCEKYGTKEKQKELQKSKSIFQQQEDGRKYRYHFNKKLAGLLTDFILFIALILFAFPLMKIFSFKSVVGVLAFIECIIIIFLIIEDKRIYKNHKGDLEELWKDLIESNQIIHERVENLNKIIQKVTSDFGYDYEKVVKFLQQQYQVEVIQTFIPKLNKAINNWIMPITFGLSSFVNFKTAIDSLIIIVLLTLGTFLLGSGIAARDLGFFTKKEIFLHAFGDCLYYIELKNYEPLKTSSQTTMSNRKQT